MIAVLGVPFDASSGAKLGGQFAPKAYREASSYYWTHTQIDGKPLVEIESREGVDPRVFRERIRDLGDVPILHVDWDVTSARIREASFRIHARGAFAVALGGDHLITSALVQGYQDAVVRRSGGRIGYIRFSSCLDLGDEDRTWGRVWRGTTNRRLIETGVVDTGNMVWIGTNGYVRFEEWQLAQKLRVRVFTSDEVRARGIEEVVTEAVKTAKSGCDGIYVSIDMDVVDGGYLAATPAPRFDGLRNADLLTAMGLLGRADVQALDVCGLNPTVEVMGQGKTGQRFGVHLVLRFAHAKMSAIAGDAWGRR
jgi:agmatinase